MKIPRLIVLNSVLRNCQVTDLEHKLQMQCCKTRLKVLVSSSTGTKRQRLVLHHPGSQHPAFFQNDRSRCRGESCGEKVKGRGVVRQICDHLQPQTSAFRPIICDHTHKPKAVRFTFLLLPTPKGSAKRGFSKVFLLWKKPSPFYYPFPKSKEMFCLET